MWVIWFTCAVFLVGTTTSYVLGPETKHISEEFYHEYLHFKATGVRSERFKELLHKLSYHRIERSESPFRPTMCNMCDSLVRAFFNYYQSGKTPEELTSLVLDLCVLLEIQTKEVCSGLIKLNLGPLLYIIENTPTLTPERVCGILLQTSNCVEDDPALDWTINITLGNKPPLHATDVNLKNDAETITIVHLTDIHYDPTYTVGGNAECEEPTCCRLKEGPPSQPEGAAGQWGDYRNCDSPWHALDNMFQHIVQQHKKIDYIYMTGDLVDHGVWETSRELNKETFNQVYNSLKETFDGIPVFPALGNHEPSPLNVYAPPEITDDALSTQWLYDTMLQHWSDWLPASAANTILKGGFYTALARPGLRVVVLNNNVCYTYNWWLFYDSRDPAGQLQWLADTLLKAEADGEKVHILAHIPPGNGECHKVWSREFRKIIDRFEQTVMGHFNGHTHNDEFHLFYALDDPNRANNVAFDGGSATTYSNLNSNYRIYTADAATGAVLDIETWIYNLTAANLNPENNPNWFKLYSFREAYGVESLSPTDLDKLVHQMAANHELLHKYQRYYVKEGDPSLASGCSTACLQERLCGIVTSHAPDQTQCEKILAEFNQNRDKY